MRGFGKVPRNLLSFSSFIPKSGGDALARARKTPFYNF
jgi:hypothetical protein